MGGHGRTGAADTSHEDNADVLEVLFRNPGQLKIIQSISRIFRNHSFCMKPP
jgi:hypothetical protein